MVRGGGEGASQLNLPCAHTYFSRSYSGRLVKLFYWIVLKHLSVSADPPICTYTPPASWQLPEWVQSSLKHWNNMTHSTPMCYLRTSVIARAENICTTHHFQSDPYHSYGIYCSLQASCLNDGISKTSATSWPFNINLSCTLYICITNYCCSYSYWEFHLVIDTMICYYLTWTMQSLSAT